MQQTEHPIVGGQAPQGWPPRPAWSLDAEWMATFRRHLAGADLLSLDVFDTALSRRCDAPVDAFAMTEARLVATIGEAARGFAEERELAESDARALAHARGHDDITLDEILAALARRVPALGAHLPAMREAELEAERSLVFGVPEIQEAVRLAQEAGKPVVFVSDMYLPGAEIRRLLEISGYAGPLDLTVSSETRRSKGSGRVWALLRERFGDAARILHIGDDAWSDVESPKRVGIDALHFARARSDRRPGAPLNPAVLPFSFAARRAVLPEPPQTDPAGFMRGFGASWGAVVVGSFLRWVESRVQQLGIERVVFCARDGWLVKRAWEEAGCGARTRIPATYLHVSRRTLNLAEAAMPTPDGRLAEGALDTLCHARAPVGRLLSRAGLMGCAALVEEAGAEFGGLDTVVPWQDWPRLREVLRRHDRAILAALAPMRQAVVGYLAQEGMDGRRQAIVDIGWHGTLQAAIARLLRDGGTEPRLTGLYYGLWPAAQRRRPVAGWMEGCFGNDFLSFDEQPGLVNAVALLENLHLADDGTTTGYRQEDGRWRPVLQDSRVERAQQAALIQPFQDATVAALREIFATGRSGTLTLAELTREAGLAAISRVALSPTETELAVLGRIRHARDFDHTDYVPLVPDALPPCMGTTPDGLPGETDWAVGAARSWLAQLRGRPERGEFAARMRAALEQSGHRTLRQFT
ncbi:HAD family hydrolase [Falsiroseomonas sp. CW058]|uniref:HAD family hydrolase n=1 Tax=Falsiroseomonas sp. CW058 TaxID=3388664 RepID=UPI003D30FD3F